MVRDTARQLTEYLRDRVGDALRTVVLVQEGGWDLHYLRSDLQEEYTDGTYTEVVDSFRLERPFLYPGTEAHPVGERRAIVHYHENAFVVQLPVSETDSILVSLAPDAGRHLLEFVEACRNIVDDGV